MDRTPKRVDRFNEKEILIEWASGESFHIPFVEVRFDCPCAGCVDEHTGARTLKREQIRADIRPLGAKIVGRYALHVQWNDGHQTGMYHFDRLYDLCISKGAPILN